MLENIWMEIGFFAMLEKNDVIWIMLMFFSREAQEDSAVSRLEELSISKATPTHLRSATEREVTFTLEQLAQDARASLLGVRSTYLMAFAHSEAEVIKSR